MLSESKKRRRFMGSIQSIERTGVWNPKQMWYRSLMRIAFCAVGLSPGSRMRKLSHKRSTFSDRQPYKPGNFYPTLMP